MINGRDQALQRLLASIPTDSATTQDPAQWWQNRRANGGLRLSTWAHNQLLSWAAPCWSFDLDPTWITPRNMLRMDRLIPVPYSLETSSRPRRAWITVWDSGHAMTIELVGDFDRFLVNMERAWQRGI